MLCSIQCWLYCFPNFISPPLHQSSLDDILDHNCPFPLILSKFVLGPEEILTLKYFEI